MSNRVIEPSEIITGDRDPRGPNPSQVNPWVRLVARLFDYALFFLLLRLFLPSSFYYPEIEQILPLEFFAWVPIETLLLATWGTTPGKWLLGTKLIKRYAKVIDFETAFKRSFYVWFRGIGMGISFVNLMCMTFGYYRLRTQHCTSWDRDTQILVQHRPIPEWRFYLVSFLTLAGLIFYSYSKHVW
jgi:uncharacterized RDD family membrane protein YckC